MPGYLAADSTAALFLQWTRTGDTLTGTSTTARIGSSDPTKIETNTVNFTGTVSGSSITLNLESGDTWNGTFAGSGLTLTYPSGNGTLATFSLSPSDVSAYNAAVQQLYENGAADATATVEAQPTATATPDLFVASGPIIQSGTECWLRRGGDSPEDIEIDGPTANHECNREFGEFEILDSGYQPRDVLQEKCSGEWRGDTFTIYVEGTGDDPNADSDCPKLLAGHGFPAS